MTEIGDAVCRGSFMYKTKKYEKNKRVIRKRS